MTNKKIALYSSVGAELTHYDVDVAGLQLTRRATITASSNVQYAWPHPSGEYLYLIASPRRHEATHSASGDHHLAAYRIDHQTGALTQQGSSQPLTHRPLHICVDQSGHTIFVAYNDPSALTVHRINPDGSVGTPVAQSSHLNFGIFAHQVRVTPDNKQVILVTRGNSAADGKPEDPGALKVFRFDDGQLTAIASIAPGMGYGFGPRHLDFHPTQPWVYVSLERQNQLQVLKYSGGEYQVIPEFTRDTLIAPSHRCPRQLGGTIHVHPNGRFVYVANRADRSTEVDGKRVFAGGENNIAVYALDQNTGEPALIQHMETHGIHVRTFTLDPSGQMLIAASILSLWVREGADLVEVPAGLSVFRVRADGRLEFVRRYAVDTANNVQFWMGLYEHPQAS